MTGQFDRLIKSMQREVVDQKAIRRRSSLTLQTISKTIAVPCTIARNGSGSLYCQKSGLAIATPNGSLPQVYQATFGSRSQRGNRGIEFILPQYSQSGAAIAVVPTFGEQWDGDLANNQSKIVNIPITITSTGDFALQASSMNYGRE